MDNVCPKCGEKQYSAMDKKYLEIYDHCWSCDRKNWENNIITLEIFENREAIAMAQSIIRD